VDFVTAAIAIIKALAELIRALAWPAAAFGIAWVLRQEIRALLARISGIKYKDLEIAIRENLDKTREALPESTREESRQLLTAPKKDVAELMRLAPRSPREAIMESWTLLQDALIELAKRKGHNPLDLPASVPYYMNVFHFLLTKDLIPESVAGAIHRLGAIRNSISENPDFQPTVSDAEEFVLYSAAVREDLAKVP
jgi:hypothetical protein